MQPDKLDSAAVTPHHRDHWRTLIAAMPVWDEFGLRLGSTYTMFHAESALMRRHAEQLRSVERSRVLDVGVGLGVFAREALALGAASYTGIELHPEVALWADRTLKQEWPDRRIVVLTGAWQEHLAELPRYDCIMYDTWPPAGSADDDFERFVSRAARHHLAPAGRLSFFCSGAPSSHRLQVLDRFFEEVRQEIFRVEPLPPAWNKPDGLCTVCAGLRPRSSG